MKRSTKLGGLLAGLLATGSLPAFATGEGMLEHLKHHSVLTVTVPQNGDQNPYAIVVAPVSAGKIQKNDVLVTNFNNSRNLQGLGSTIVDYNPTTKQLSTFATLQRHWDRCPGGMGMTTAMTMLKSGWVLAGSLPSEDGTTTTKGPGCIAVIDPNGNPVDSITGPEINGPWGNMAVIDNGDTAKVFVSNTGFGVESPGQDVVNKATIVRLDLKIPAGKPPVVVSKTIVANGLGEQSDKDVFIVGPTGLALGANGDLYASDAINNRIVAIPNAADRTDSAGTGREITKDGLLKRPLALATAPNGHLLVSNGTNGQIVEMDPISGKQIYAQWVDPNKAQTPPGSGDLFGLAVTPDGTGIYYVEDELNALALAH